MQYVKYFLSFICICDYLQAMDTRVIPSPISPPQQTNRRNRNVWWKCAGVQAAGNSATMPA